MNRKPIPSNQVNKNLHKTIGYVSHYQNKIENVNSVKVIKTKIEGKKVTQLVIIKGESKQVVNRSINRLKITYINPYKGLYDL